MVRLLKIGILMLAVVVVAGAFGLYWFLNSDSFDRWARQKAIDFLEQRFAIEAEIERLDIRLFENEVDIWGLILRNRAFPSQEPAIEIDRIVLDFSILTWFTPTARLDRLSLERPRLRFREDPNDRMNILNMFDPIRLPEKPSDNGNGFSFLKLAIRQIELKEGLVLFDKDAILVDSTAESLDTEMRFVESGPAYQGRFSLSGFHLAIDQFVLPESSIASNFEYAGDQLHLSGLEYQSGGVLARLEGSIPGFSPFSYDFSVDLESDLRKLKQPDLSDFLDQGTIHTTGRFRGSGSDFHYKGQVESARLVVKQIPILQMRADLELDPEWVNFSTIEAKVYGGRTTAAGRLAWHDENRSHFTVQASGVEIRPILIQFGPPNLRPQGNADLQAELEWPGVHLDRFQGPADSSYQGRFMRPLSLNLEPLEPVSFSGESTLQFGGGRIRFQQGHVLTPQSRIDYQGTVDFEGRYDFQVAVDSELGSELMHLARLSQIAPEDWIERYPVELTGPARLQAHVHDQNGSFELQGEAVSRNLTFRNRKLGDFTSTVRLTENVLELTGARLKTAEFSLSTDLHYPFDDEAARPWPAFELDLHRIPIERFLVFVGLSYPVRGLMTGNFRLEQTGASSFQGGGNLTVRELRGFGEEIEEMEIELQLRQNLLSAPRIRGTAYGGSFSGDAGYDWESQDYQIDLKLQRISLQQVNLVQHRANLRGDAVVVLHSRGNLNDPRGRVQFHSSSLWLDDYQFEDLQIDASMIGTKVDFRLEHRFQDEPFLIEGNLQLEEPYPLHATLDMERLPVKPFLSLLGEISLPSFDGRVTARVSASGPLQDLARMEGTAQLSALEITTGDYTLTSTPPAEPLTYRQGVLQLPRIQFTGRDTDLEVSGTVKFFEPQQVNVRVSGTANLQIVNGFIQEGSASGALRINTEIFGDLAKPRIAGQVDLQEGFLNHPALPTGIFEARGELKFTANQVSIDTFQARTRYGSISAEGGIFLEGLQPTRWQINLFGNGLRVQVPEDVTSIIDVDLDFLKREDSQLLSGVVYIRSAEYTRVVSIPELISSYTAAQAASVSPPSGEEMVLDVAVESHRSIHIRNNLADLVASGDFTVRGTLQNPVILGNIIVDDGELFLENNRYEITRAAVNFNNPRRTSPVLNMEAETEVRDFTVTIQVRGPLNQFNISFRSDPPLPTASVVSLLAAGQTQEEIFGSETTGQTESGALAVYGAGSLLSRTLGEKLESRTSRLFGFEKFSIDPFLQGRQRDPGARLTLGKQITGKLSVTYITNLGNQTEAQLVVIEYRVTDWLTAVGTRQEDGSIAIDFKLKKRF